MNIAPHIQKLRAFVAVIGALASLFVVTAHAHAASLVVTSTASSGAGTLRQAVLDAAPGDTIVFAPDVSGTINTSLTFTKSLTIQGPGADVLATTGAGGVSHMEIPVGTSNVQLAISGLTIRDNFTLVGGTSPGITIRGTANVLTVTNVVIRDNLNFSFGPSAGAIYVGPTNRAIVSGSTFSGNRYFLPGTAVFNEGVLTMTNSTFFGNGTQTAFANLGQAALTNVTFVSHTIAISNTGSGVVALTNSLLFSSTLGNCAGAGFVSLGGNLSGDASCAAFTQSTDVNNTNPLVGPLQNNGGSTPTNALLVGSPAVGAGVAANCPATDQRGVVRPQGAACDIGAVEFVSLTQTITFGPLANRPITDPPFAITATASSGLTVTFASLTPATCVVGDTPVALVAVGTCTLRASQGGDRFYQAAEAEQSFTVEALTQTIAFDPPADRPANQPPFVITATASSGLTVTFVSLTASVCTTSNATVTIVAAGVCTVRASQPGNPIYGPAPDVDRSFTAEVLGQTIAFAPPPDRAIGDAAFTVAPTATSGLTVSLVSLTPTACAADGYKVTLITPGTCTLRASQAGSAIYRAAPSVERSFTVNRREVMLPVVIKEAQR